MSPQDNLLTDNYHPNDRTGIIHHWLDLLEKYNVRFMVLDPQQDGQFIAQLQTRPDWVIEFANHEAIFFVCAETVISF
jgi:hypothetical protein